MKNLHYSFSTLKTVCSKDLATAKLAKDVDKVTCPGCKSGIQKLLATGGN